MAHLGKCAFLFCASICTHMMGECEAAGVMFCYLFSFDVQVVLDESAFTRLRTEFLISGTQSPRDDLGSVSVDNFWHILLYTHCTFTLRLYLSTHVCIGTCTYCVSNQGQGT